MLARPAHPPLTYTKFSPARPDTAIKWTGAQIWQGAPRADGLLVADCIDEEWAKSLANSFNEATSMSAKVAAATQALRDLVLSLSESAEEYKATDPKVAEGLTALIASVKAKAKQAGLSVA